MIDQTPHPDLAPAAAGDTLLSTNSAADDPAVAALQGLLHELSGLQHRAAYDPGVADGDFGQRTRASVLAFQRDHGLVADGVVGRETLAYLAAVLAHVKGEDGPDTQPPARGQFRLVVDLLLSRITVLDAASGAVVARYLTSPGTAAHPTLGTEFTIASVRVRPDWTPPHSEWAEDLHYQPPGISNPMGIFAMSLGGYGEYIHGTPANERAGLGRPASHGCLRMSNENVLHLHHHYAGVGTKVSILRDAAGSAALDQQLRDAGLGDCAITDGAELVEDAIAGRVR